MRAAARDDEAFLRQHIGQLVRELARMNIHEAFVQTPGPRAGQPLYAKKPEPGRAA